MSDMSGLNRMTPDGVRYGASSVGKASVPASSANRSYADSEEVVRRANVAGADTPEQVEAVNRLSEQLSAGQPLRDDVPRGYHLDILV